MVETAIYKEAVDKWGKKHQLMVTVEEMAEASAKIAQYINRGRDVEEDMVDELADVCIMMKQMEVIYGNQLTEAILRKIKKLKGYL